MKNVAVVLLVIFALTQAFQYSAITFDEKQRASALQFWTPQMMKRAVPMERFIKEKDFKEYFRKEITQKEIVKADTEYVKPESLYQKKPYKGAGKVYFLFGGRPASCSGSSSGNNVVLTAAHCVYLEGNFHEKFVFVPQYNNGSKPEGMWAAKEFMIFDAWKDQDMGRDVAFAITAKQDGKSLEDQVGKIKIGSCDVDDDYMALGYPGPDYGGEKMVRTVGKIIRRFPFSPWTPAPVGIRSKQGPGSSGGPWVSPQKNSKTGEIKYMACSVNSFGLRWTYYVFGPFFDADVLAMHKIAVSKE
eukprot:gene11515-4679_t